MRVTFDRLRQILSVLCGGLENRGPHFPEVDCSRNGFSEPEALDKLQIPALRQGMKQKSKNKPVIDRNLRVLTKGGSLSHGDFSCFISTASDWLKGPSTNKIQIYESNR